MAGRWRMRLLAGITLVFGVALTGVSATAADAQDKEFVSQIRPLLVRHCSQCHGADSP